MQSQRFGWPSGYGDQSLVAGAFLPGVFLGLEYRIADFGALGLVTPPAQCAWVRYGDDLLLVNYTTGQVVTAMPGAFSAPPSEQVTGDQTAPTHSADQGGKPDESSEPDAPRPLDGVDFAQQGKDALARGDASQAVALLTKAIGRKSDLQGDNLELAYTLRGEAYLKTGQFSRAEDDLRKAVVLKPDDEEASTYLAYAVAHKTPPDVAEDAQSVADAA